MDGSPNNLRIMWQFFEKDFLATDAFKNPRDFHRFDEKYFDHFNIRVSEVRERGRQFQPVTGYRRLRYPVLSIKLDVSCLSLFIENRTATSGGGYQSWF